MNPEQAIADVFGLYEKHGTADYIGEPVSQIEHMSQAAQLAMAEGFDDEVVLAAFFHDIGHLCGQGCANMGGYGVVSHERLGADYLRRAGFSDVRCVDVSVTTVEEQRGTEWMKYQSLSDFLDPEDHSKTIEGLPAPMRAVIIARK